MTQKKYKITVDYGYDTHSMTVSQKVMDQIKNGEAVSVRGQGFYIEGDKERDDWSFHCTAPDSLEVECDNGHQVFIGELSDATITEI
jgi:hypothetical protein